MAGSIARNLSLLRSDVASTARGCGRDPASVGILAVSKTFPPPAIEQASEAGQQHFGENRIQEALSKIPAVRRKDLTWHLVGHLQSNKVRRAVELFDVIHTIDSEKIATRISRCCEDLGKTIQVFVQVNIGEEGQKSGFSPRQVSEIVRAVDSLPYLSLSGLMCIPPFHENPEQMRPYFRATFSLLADINQYRAKPLTALSMGMSGDYRVAIEEGATLIRLGTAIFGPRAS